MWLRIALLVSLVGCTGSGTNELDNAQARWEENRPSSYSFVFVRSCECIDAGREIEVSVTGDAITAARYLDDNTPVMGVALTSLSTVDDVFLTIADAIDRDAFSLSVQYDATLGYPTNVSVDYDKQIADDEFSLRLEDLAVE